MRFKLVTKILAYHCRQKIMKPRIEVISAEIREWVFGFGFGCLAVSKARGWLPTGKGLFHFWRISMEVGTKLKNTEVTELDQRKTKTAKGRVFKTLSSEQARVCVWRSRRHRRHDRWPQCVNQALHICVMSAKLHVGMYVHMNQAETSACCPHCLSLLERHQIEREGSCLQFTTPILCSECGARQRDTWLLICLCPPLAKYFSNSSNDKGRRKCVSCKRKKNESSKSSTPKPRLPHYFYNIIRVS